MDSLGGDEGTTMKPDIWNEPRCPVPDTVLSAMMRATPSEIQSLARLLPEIQRVHFALFCYSRAHLRDIGKTVATVCADGLLVRYGSTLGQALIQQRDVRDVTERKRPVSLARCA